MFIWPTCQKCQTFARSSAILPRQASVCREHGRALHRLIDWRAWHTIGIDRSQGISELEKIFTNSGQQHFLKPWFWNHVLETFGNYVSEIRDVLESTHVSERMFGKWLCFGNCLECFGNFIWCENMFRKLYGFRNHLTPPEPASVYTKLRS